MNALRHVAAQIASLLAVVGATSVAACHAQEPESPTPGLTKPIDPPQPPDLGRGAPRADIQVRYHIWLADTVQDVCKGPPPYFEFDSAEASGADQPTMKTLATCMAEGPLKGKTIRLIGHTDPRGTEGYNEKLGLERAERVKQYLVNHGIEGKRVMVESAGEDEARPTRKDWPKDRRVEIEIAK